MRTIDADELKEKLTELKQNKLTPSWSVVLNLIDNAPTVEITEEQAIDKLHETGWLPLHDRIMTERPQGGQVVPDMLQGWKYEERPQGMWIELRDYDFKCSLCGFSIMDKYNYCPECGARLE